MRINSVVSRNLASLPGSVPMALAILAAGPSNLVVLGGAFLLCEEEEEEPEEWWDLEEGVELVLVKKLISFCHFRNHMQIKGKYDAMLL